MKFSSSILMRHCCRMVISGLCLFLVLFLSAFSFFSFFMPDIKAAPGSAVWFQTEIQRVSEQATNLDPHIVQLSLEAYLNARKKGYVERQLVTIIDYSKPSVDRRLWVIDLRNAKVLFNTWVTHGKNSGNNTPTSFSNELGSLKSSLGVFLTTKDPYNGSNGYSLRLVGLENGVNDQAYKRAIVFHGAWYADPSVIKKFGTLGRSWGCPAVSLSIIKPLINTIKNKSMVFVYYPDRHWLGHSTFLS